MVRLFSRKPEEDPARQRYPEAVRQLLSLGRPDESTDYSHLSEEMAEHVTALIQMVLDEDLNRRLEDDPAVWAPLHAMHVLGELRAVEAAEPLVQCLDWNDDWSSEALPGIFAGIGPAAMPVLQDHLEDAAHNVWGRIRAAESLAAIGEAHAGVRSSVVQNLTDYLDRPTADDNADEELLTSFIISSLADLEACEAYPAIKRAFEEDRVNPQIIGLEDVEVDLGIRPEPDYTRLEPRQEPGVRLELKCKVCGRERRYLFPQVYCDLGTMRNKKKLARYGPIIIPQPVTCTKCGSVDQYELSNLGQMAVIADLIAQTKPELESFRREDQRVQYIQFEAMGRKMHPQEAIERYQAEIARHPSDRDLYVGYGNVLRFLGRFEEARAQYQQAMELDPLDPSAYADMAVLAVKQGNRAEAITLWQQVLEVTRSSQLSDEEKGLYLQSAHEAIEAIRAGNVDDLVSGPKPQSVATRTPEGGKAQLTKRATTKSVKVRRNDPCPCGSGKKYKHCCMTKQP